MLETAADAHPPPVAEARCDSSYCIFLGGGGLSDPIAAPTADAMDDRGATAIRTCDGATEIFAERRGNVRPFRAYERVSR